MNQMVMTERSHTVDLMKFFAAILITNSHMGSLYPEKYHLLATGGAIGDALFFFCSGFCLMLGKKMDFFNWYKRRINRIFPTIFAVAIIAIVFLGGDPTLKHVLIYGGGWFVQAIFVFYVVFWFVKQFLSDRLWCAFVINSVIILVWFIWFWDKSVFILYSDTYLRWPCYFMVMMMGAATSNSFVNKKEDGKALSSWLYASVLIVLLALYYGYQFVMDRCSILKEFQIVLLPTLMGIIYTVYRLCSTKKILAVYQNKYIYWALYGISACCLEIYLSGGYMMSIEHNLISMFPLNVFMTFISIFIVAYFVRIFSNFLSQTFKSESYDWRGLVKL